MNTPAQIARQLKEFYYGVNWTWSNMKDQLSDLTWQQATEKVCDFNTIATLVYHINYYAEALIKVLQGGPLDASDKYSFNTPAIAAQEDWESLLNDTWSNANKLATLVEQFPEKKLVDTFFEEKYGNYFRNLSGFIEHGHYHLGQIVLIKKLLKQRN